MEICELKKNDEKSWDEYVFDQPDSTFYHQIGWKNVVERSYGYKPYYLIARDGGEIKGILPMFFIKSLLLRRKLVSVPFAPYGGAIGEKSAVGMLVDHVVQLAKELNVKYMEFRSAGNSSTLLTNSYYSASILDLDQNPKIVWNAKLTRNKRKNVVKSQKRDLKVEFIKVIDAFYDIFAINMRDLGSPIHSMTFFNNILKEFSDSAKVQLVSIDSKPVYAAFYLLYKDTIINSWSSSLEEYRNYYPTDFGIWAAIEYGCNNNYKHYDFGRSQQGSNNMEFKERWGAETKKLEYQYYLNNVVEIPDYTSKNPERQGFAKVWRKVPLNVAKTIGPVFRKLIP